MAMIPKQAKDPKTPHNSRPSPQQSGKDLREDSIEKNNLSCFRYQSRPEEKIRFYAGSFYNSAAPEAL